MIPDFVIVLLAIAVGLQTLTMILIIGVLRVVLRLEDKNSRDGD